MSFLKSVSLLKFLDARLFCLFEIFHLVQSTVLLCIILLCGYFPKSFFFCGWGGGGIEFHKLIFCFLLKVFSCSPRPPSHCVDSVLQVKSTSFCQHSKVQFLELVMGEVDVFFHFVGALILLFRVFSSLAMDWSFQLFSVYLFAQK